MRYWYRARFKNGGVYAVVSVDVSRKVMEIYHDPNMAERRLIMHSVSAFQVPLMMYSYANAGYMVVRYLKPNHILGKIL